MNDSDSDDDPKPIIRRPAAKAKPTTKAALKATTKPKLVNPMCKPSAPPMKQ